MSAELITAIAGMLAGIGGILTAIMMYNKTMAVVQEQIKTMKEKLDSHNGYAKLFTDTSQEISKIQTDIAVIKTTLEFLEKEVKK